MRAGILPVLLTAVFSAAHGVPDTQQMLKQYLLNEC